MLCRLALLTLLGALAACDAPPRDKVSNPPVAEDKEVAPALSKQQVFERSEQCGKTARDQFRREWKEATVTSADGKMTADFANHYNAKLNTCFYLLTVAHYTNKNGPAGASATTLRRKLFDINEGELYGEYSGPATFESTTASFPTTCRVVSLFCASNREWEVLIEPFMEE